MAIHREISVKLANSPGSAGRVTQVLGAERINLLAMSLDGSGMLRVIVDNPVHAAGTLREQHYHVEERDVLLTTVPNEPGALARTLKLVADAGLNIDYAYASGNDRHPMVSVVIGVEDASKAAYATGL